MSEQHYERPDARPADRFREAGWVVTAQNWARITGILAVIDALPLIFYAPGLYVGDLSIIIGLGWFSAPAALAFSPVIGWAVSSLLGVVIRHEAGNLHPRVERVAWIMAGAVLAVLVTGVATWVAIASTPSVKWVP